MSADGYRFALVGCGSIARKHVTAIDRIEGAKIVAVCDVNPDAGSEVAERLGVPAYQNARKMAEEEEFEVFTILTPSGVHAGSILELADLGRHFVVEKPLALRVDEADQVIETCDRSGSKLFVVQQNRYNRPVRKLKETIDSGRFGKQVMGTVRVRWCRRQDYYDAKEWRGTWQYDGGVLTNQASHHIDMLGWLLGDVDTVMAMTSTRLADIEAEDTGVAILRFASGALGIIEATTCTRPEDLEGSISVLGERGAVEIGGYYMNDLKTWQFEDDHPDDDMIDEWGSNPDEWAWNHTEYLRDMLRSLRDGTRGLVDGIEGRKSLELIHAIYESAETGKATQLRFRPERCRLGLPG